MFETSAETDKLDAALAKAQAEIEGAAKDKKNPHFKSSYADLSSVWDACREPLTKNGINVTQWPVHSEDGRLHMVSRMAHAGQWYRAHASIPAPKQDPQGYGSAITYLRRFALAAMVGVAPRDDDGEGAMHRNVSSATSPTPNEPMAAKITPNSTWAELADYRVPMGKKYKGKRLGEVPIEELKNFLDWLAVQPDLDNRAREFLLIGDSFYQQATARDMVGNDGR